MEKHIWIPACAGMTAEPRGKAALSALHFSSKSYKLASDYKTKAPIRGLVLPSLISKDTQGKAVLRKRNGQVVPEHFEKGFNEVCQS